MRHENLIWLMRRAERLIGVAVIVGISGCVGSPVHTKSLNAQDIKSVSNRNLCYAVSRGSEFKTKTIMSEIQRRGIDCAAINRENGIYVGPPATVDFKSGACKGIEFMGVYQSAATYGVRAYKVKVRNAGPVAKRVTVWYWPGKVIERDVHGKRPYGKTTNLEVDAGRIATATIDVSSMPPRDAAIIRCR